MRAPEPPPEPAPSVPCLEPPPSPPPRVEAPSPPRIDPEELQVVQLISYAHRTATLTPEQQRREFSASNHAFARDKDAISRMRLALLLATSSAGFQDAARAASLLEPLAAPNAAISPMNSLARILYAQLNERVREQKRANQMREQVDTLTESERTLREQLEALKEVERTIIERGLESQPRRK